MRRLVAITAFALSLSVPLWSQHGGHAGGGGHAGFSGGHVGGFGGHVGGFSGHGGFGGGHAGFGGPHGFSGGHPGFGRGRFAGARGFSGMRGGFGASRRLTHVSPYRRRGGSSFSSRRGFRNRRHFFNDFDFDDCPGLGCGNWWWGWGNPWWYPGYYDPWWWNSGSSYDEDYERDRAIANEMNQQSLEEQRMLHQEEANGDQDAYARPVPATGPQPSDSAAQPATVLIFRDQRRREVQNYAIVGQTLWNFAPQRTEKISLADLDLVATVKANDDRGLSFSVPGPGGSENR